MAMTDPAAKEEVYLARFYRAGDEGDGKMLHAQKDTLNNIASLCSSSRNYADILLVGSERVIGRVNVGGIIDWIDDPSEIEVAVARIQADEEFSSDRGQWWQARAIRLVRGVQ